MYLREIAGFAPLDEGVVEALMQRTHDGDGDAKYRLVQAHLALVVDSVRDCGRPMTLDLIQAGNLGLIRAAEDIGRREPGQPFRVFALPFVQAALDQADEGPTH